MSIINDALKKTQSAREKKRSITPTPTPSAPQMDPATVKTIATEKDIQQISAPKKKTNEHRVVILGTGIAIIVLGLFFNILIKPILLPEENTITDTEEITSTSTTPAVAEFKTPVIQVHKTAAPKRKIEIMPFKKTAPKNELTLNGIVYSGDDGKKSFVLINNEIYEVGESVNGKKVVSITKNEVTLDDNGQPLILKLKRLK